jgi:hypothetical protein
VKDEGLRWKNDKCISKDALFHPFRIEESVISCPQNPFMYEGIAKPEKRSPSYDSSPTFMEDVRWSNESEREPKIRPNRPKLTALLKKSVSVNI